VELWLPHVRLPFSLASFFSILTPLSVNITCTGTFGAVLVGEELQFQRQVVNVRDLLRPGTYRHVTRMISTVLTYNYLYVLVGSNG